MFYDEIPKVSVIGYALELAIISFHRRSHSAQYGETFDGPPTLERSGCEHRVGRLHPSFLRREGLVRMWSSPCRRDGEVEKTPSLMVRKDG